MPRPKFDDREAVRTEIVSFRVTAAEKKKIQSKAKKAGLTVRDFILRHIKI